MSLLNELAKLDKRGAEFNADSDGRLQCRIPKRTPHNAVTENISVIREAIANRKALLQRHNITVTDKFPEINAKQVFMDLETTGLDPFTDKMTLVSVLTENNVVLYTGKDLQPLRDTLKDPHTLKVFQNSKFDLSMLGWTDPVNLFDTMLAECVIDPSAFGRDAVSLQTLCWKYLHAWMPKKAATSFTGGKLTDEQIKYAAFDVISLKEIMPLQVKKLEEHELVETAKLEFDIVPALVAIECWGVPIDLEKLAELNPRLVEEASRIEKDLNQFIGQAINWNSPQQVVSVLKQKGYEIESSSAEVLKKHKGELVEKFQRYKKIKKRIDTFIETWPKHVHELTGRIHPDFKQLGTKTGRFSCSNPNLQQVPREQEWRDLFTAPEGYKIITVDYGQIELRIIAEFTKDEAFLKILSEGGDIHAKTAANIFHVPLEQVTKEQRNIAKSINFGLSYGMKTKGLAEKVDIEVKDAQNFIDRYFETYPGVKRGLDKLGYEAMKKGYSITPLGRKRFFSRDESPNHLGRNSPIQATCGDILKRAIFYLHEYLRDLDAHIINLVHDEILIEVREDLVEKTVGIIKREMKQAGADFLKLVPVEVDITVNQAWRK